MNSAASSEMAKRWVAEQAIRNYPKLRIRRLASPWLGMAAVRAWAIRVFTPACFAAFELLMRKKYITYTIVVLIASTFHGSALLMLPFSYVMLGSALNKKSFLMIGAVVAMGPSDGCSDALPGEPSGGYPVQ